MAQGQVQRKLVRTAAGFNSKAARLGAQGKVNAEDLARLYLEAEGRCHYCGIELEPLSATYDHVISFDRGGHNTLDNIVVSCTADQRAKFTKNAEEFQQYQDLMVRCTCGRMFKPRWADYRRGYGRYCSRGCSGRAGGVLTK